MKHDFMKEQAKKAEAMLLLEQSYIAAGHGGVIKDNSHWIFENTTGAPIDITSIDTGKDIRKMRFRHKLLPYPEIDVPPESSNKYVPPQALPVRRRKRKGHEDSEQENESIDLNSQLSDDLSIDWAPPKKQKVIVPVMNVDNNNIIDSVLKNEAPYMHVPEATLNGRDQFILTCSKFDPADARVVFNSVDITGHMMKKKGKSTLDTNRMTRKAYDKMAKHIEWADSSKPTTGEEEQQKVSKRISFLSGSKVMEIAEDSSNTSYH